MLSWLFPKPPLGAREKAWVETRMQWLTTHFGIDPLLNVEVLLPTAEYFPDQYQGELADAERFCEQLCRRFEVDPAGIEVAVSGPDRQGETEPQTPGMATIELSEHDFLSPERLIAAICHGLARRRLAGRSLVPADEATTARLAELVPMQCGLGVLVANAASQMQRPLSAQAQGYALALFALVRNEQAPAWANHLGADAGAYFRRASRYLQRTGDTVFSPASILRGEGERGDAEVLNELQQGTPSKRIAALWEVASRGEPAAFAVPAVIEMLGDANPDIRGEAANTLACFGSLALAAQEPLLDCLRDRQSEVRAAAARALGSLQFEHQGVLSDLADAMGDEETRVRVAASMAIAAYGERAESIVPEVLKRLRNTLVHCGSTEGEVLVATLCAIAADPETRIREYFTEHDEDLRTLAMELLPEVADS